MIPISAAASFFTCVCTTCFLVYGFWLRSTFQNGIECDLTWSVVNFLILPLSKKEQNENIEIHTSPYRLLKFIDGRDRRYSHLIYLHDRDKTDGDTYHFRQPNYLDQDEEGHSKNNNYGWCHPDPKTNGNRGHIVLFIPGHEGQYKQARSVAAHGVTLSRHPKDMAKIYYKGYLKNTKEKLKNGTMDGVLKGSEQSIDIENFVYDVYTVDFNGEGSAWHASKLYAQVDFLMRAIEVLADECQLSSFSESITIVAHSIGGIVARRAIASLQNKEERHLIKNVITLASPHQYIPFVLDQSIMDFHGRLRNDEEKLIKEGRYDTVFVSISGGLRDELIPQQSVHYTYADEYQQTSDSSNLGKNRFLTVLASDIMKSRVEQSYNGPRYGMDHKCIVWCHGLLSTVRELIHNFVTINYDSITKQEREDEISHLLQKQMTSNGLNCNTFTENSTESSQSCHERNCSYRCRAKHKESYLKKNIGFLSSVALKGTMWHNIRPFVFLYILNATIYQFIIFIKDMTRKASYKSLKSNKKLTALYIWSYMICPLISCILLLSYYSIIWEEPNRIALLLSYAAMNLYVSILFGIIPLLVYLKSVIRRKMFLFLRRGIFIRFGASKIEESLNFLPRKAFMRQQKYLLKVSIVIHAIYCITRTCFMKANDYWILNTIAVQSHCFMIIMILILLSIINLGFCEFNMKKDAQSSDEMKNETNHERSVQMHCRMFTSLALPIFPLLILGKFIFFASLLTVSGQSASLPYQKIVWRDDCERFLKRATGVESEMYCVSRTGR